VERHFDERTDHDFIMAHPARSLVSAALRETGWRHLVDPASVCGGSCDVFTDLTP
jgi:hypothetical protein